MQKTIIPLLKPSELVCCDLSREIFQMTVEDTCIFNKKNT